MPDICMCKDEECPKKNECYRYTAIPSEFMQVYFSVSPRKDEVCEYFYPIKKRKTLISK